MENVFYSEQRHRIVIGQIRDDPLPRVSECDYDRDTETWD